MNLRTTYTNVNLHVPRQFFDMVKERLLDAGCDHAVDNAAQSLDMHGIALVPGDCSMWQFSHRMSSEPWTYDSVPDIGTPVLVMCWHPSWEHPWFTAALVRQIDGPDMERPYVEWVTLNGQNLGLAEGTSVWWAPMPSGYEKAIGGSR